SPDSKRDSVLSEIPVIEDRSANVRSCCWRRARSRGPTVVSTWSSPASITIVCRIGKNPCQSHPPGSMVLAEVNRSTMNYAHPAAKYDVLVIGGGAAGLSGALVLARSRRSVLVIDAGAPRNAPAAAMHNFLSRDGMNPLALLEVGRVELRGYGGEVVEARVRSAARQDDGFSVALEDGGMLSARRLLVASGLVDQLA